MNNDEIQELKSISLVERAQALSQLIIQRINILTTISSISAGGAAVVMAVGEQRIHNFFLLYINSRFSNCGTWEFGYKFRYSSDGNQTSYTGYKRSSKSGLER
ncbi:MAG: hypothetical protein WC477_05515 [Patescibacteria group bacterium]